MDTTTEVAKATYDPTKTYKWEEFTPFILSGKEYGFIYNTLLGKKTELLKQLEILNVLEAKLRASVEAGEATELVQEKAS